MGAMVPNPMIKIGEINKLLILKEVSFGVYLDGGPNVEEILLPLKAVPKGAVPGSEIDVFLYYDSEDRLIATTFFPKAIVGEFAAMPVVEMNEIGAFVDWGIPGKDLLVPFREQIPGMEPGRDVIVRVYLDPKQGRVVGSAKIDRFLDKTPHHYRAGDEVDLLIARETDLGFSAIVNGEHWGLLYADEVFEPLELGDRKKGFIKAVRQDGKIDLSLQKRGYEKVEDILMKILRVLQENRGFLPLTDKSTPEAIYDQFGVSKKTFKQAIGALYKNRVITLDPDGIRIAPAGSGHGSGGKKPR